LALCMHNGFPSRAKGLFDPVEQFIQGGTSQYVNNSNLLYRKLVNWIWTTC
jgi:hypothetical protein